jgi:uncharacterized protein YndB with AHSA1/START domain
MRVVERFVTSAPPAIVWQVLADLEHWRDWTPTITEIRPLSSGGLKIGARYHVVQPKLKPATYEVTECVPDRSFTWMQRLAGGALIADHRLAARDGATEVELSFTSKGLLANIATGIFSKLIREYVATEARSLKNRSETLARLHTDARPFAS